MTGPLLAPGDHELDALQRARWERRADTYDDGAGDPSPATTVLSSLASDSAIALELGAGTGRVAIPLARHVKRLYALDHSARMLRRLRDRDDEQLAIPLQGSMCDLPMANEQLDLIYCINSSFFYLLTQNDQLQCFREVARCLKPDGIFVLECFNPFTSSLVGTPHTSPRKSIGIRSLTDDAVDLSISKTDFTSQVAYLQELRIDANGNRLLPTQIRFAWPSELDLMALNVGLKIQSRTPDWGALRSYVGGRDFNHISIYKHG